MATASTRSSTSGFTSAGSRSRAGEQGLELALHVHHDHRIKLVAARDAAHAAEPVVEADQSAVSATSTALRSCARRWLENERT